MLADMDKPYDLVALPTECPEGRYLWSATKVKNEIIATIIFIFNSFDKPIFYLKNQLLFQLKVRVKEVKKSAETIVDVIKCACRMA